METAKKLKKSTLSIKNMLMDNKIVIVVIVLFVGMAIASDAFLSSTNLFNVIRQICTSAIVALGFTIVVSSGNLDLSVGTMLGLIGVIMAKFSHVMPLGLALVLGLVVGALLGYANGLLITVFKINGLVATIGTQSIFMGACYLISGNSPVINLPEKFKIFGQEYVGVIPVPVIIMGTLAVIIAIVLYRTKFGRHVIAIGGNTEAARVSGVNVQSVTRKVYLAMGICCAVGAIVMTGRLGTAQPKAGQGMEIDAIAAVVLGGTSLSGGKAKVMGTIWGCLTVGIINNGLNLAQVDTNWQIIAKGLLIVAAIIMDSQTEQFLARLRKKEQITNG